MTASRFGSTSSSSRPTSVVGITQRTGAETHALLVGCEASGEVGAYEIGPLHEHDGAAAPRLGGTRRAPGPGSRRSPKGACGSFWRSSRSTRPPGTFPSWVISAATALRRYGGTRSSGVLGSLPSPLAITDRRDAAPRQLVTEQPDLRAIELALVLFDHVVDRHVHEAVAGRDAGARREHATRRGRARSPRRPRSPGLRSSGRPSNVCPHRTSRNCCRSGWAVRRRWSPSPRWRTRRRAIRGSAGRRLAGRTTRRSGARSRARATTGTPAVPVAPCAGAADGEHGHDGRGTSEGETPHCERSGSSFRPSREAVVVDLRRDLSEAGEGECRRGRVPTDGRDR